MKNGSTFKDATLAEVDKAMQHSALAFEKYRHETLKQRAVLLNAIAAGLEGAGAELIAAAASETFLEEGRLKAELQRTVFQLTSYAAACEKGDWLDIRIDTADPSRTPPKPDLRKMLIPLGPVVVFSASNFPFAYATAGGDTACALAAGCTVVLKAHPAHAATSEKVAGVIASALESCEMNGDIFIHLHGAATAVGEALVKHEATKAVGFTGSFQGGKALFDLANARPEPIPVFAEMGSVNPIFLLPQALAQNTQGLAASCAASLLQSAGQFCTNPGIMVGIESEALRIFAEKLGSIVEAEKPVNMLHAGIAKHFLCNREKLLGEEGVTLAAVTRYKSGEGQSIPTLAMVSAAAFINNTVLREEVFGPFTLLVTCRDEEDMLAVAKAIQGQLTATLIAKEEEAIANKMLIDTLQSRCGRLVLNGVPTGVEVALAMHHGGPFPATTDSRFTAVGADGIRRFARPICYQNWPSALLPPALQDANPLKLWRTVNGERSQSPLD